MKARRAVLGMTMTLAVLAGLLGGGAPAAAGTLEVISDLPEYEYNYCFYGIWGAAADDVYAVGAYGSLLHYDGTAWTIVDHGFNYTGFTDVWGGGPDDIYVVGSGSSTLIHYDGSGWSWITNPYMGYWGVWGSGPDDVYAAGGSDGILHYDGESWTEIDTIALDIWGSGPDDVYSFYGNVIRHYDGNAEGTWSTVYSGSNSFRDIWGSGPDDVYAAGTYGYLVHYDGEAWTEVDHGLTTSSFGAIWGSGPDDVFASEAGLLHYDGTSWSRLLPYIGEGFYSLWGDGQGTLYCGGNDDNLYRYTYTAAGLPVSVDLRASGAAGDVVTLAADYEVPDQEITEDGLTLAAKTPLGALTYYCQQNGIGIELAEASGTTVVTQIGGQTADWGCYLNRTALTTAELATAPLDVDDYIHFYDTSLPDITVDLRATGSAGELFTVEDYTVPFGTVAEDGYIIDSQTAAGALACYCQENSIDITLQESGGDVGVYQVGSDTGDAGAWTYYVDGTESGACAATYVLSDGEAVHWANESLVIYVLSLALDVTEIEVGDGVSANLTATVMWTDGDGLTAPAAAADVFVSTATDTSGYPVTPGSLLGQTDGNGDLVFEWTTGGGTFYPYGVWNGYDTVHQEPVVFFTCTDTSAPVYDVNGDTEIDIFDMITVGNAFGETGIPGWIAEDVNGDGIIDIFDMIMVGNHFGE